MNSAANNDRGLGAIASEMKEELKDFVQTRIEMLRQEAHEKIARLKIAAPLAAAALLLLLTAYLLITLALAAAVSAVFANSPYRWFFGFGIVGLVWALLGGVAAYFAKRELELKTLAPKRTIEVLKGDKIWLQKEVKNQV
jgi:membrane protein implicated in regulation of membrane protease activity